MLDFPLPGPDLSAAYEALRGPLAALCRGIVTEPRGHDAVVGAFLTPPVAPGGETGVVFFNNVGPLGMCGHGLMGVVRTLEFLGRLQPGPIGFDTPAGRVRAELEADGSVVIDNVEPRVHALDVALDVPELGTVVGDVAWGGNWFFLASAGAERLRLADVAELTRKTAAIRRALRQAGITGEAGAEIDHVELFGAPERPDADSRNFVLCPGGAYDRSPCGTGTSAKLAVLHARGQLTPGRRWRQESVTGGLFEAWLEQRDGSLHPRLRGRAFVTARASLFFDPDDPLRAGFR